jgi:hypothetical protein
VAARIGGLGHLVCRLTYQKASDGTVLKTLAVGPNGDIWAEYPDYMVMDIQRDGTGGVGVPTVIHKSGF